MTFTVLKGQNTTKPETWLKVSSKMIPKISLYKIQNLLGDHSRYPTISHKKMLCAKRQRVRFCRGNVWRYYNLFSLLLKLPQLRKKQEWICNSVFSCWVAIVFLIVVIEHQQENRMMKSSVTPPFNNNRIKTDVFNQGHIILGNILIALYKEI